MEMFLEVEVQLFRYLSIRCLRQFSSIPATLRHHICHGPVGTGCQYLRRKRVTAGSLKNGGGAVSATRLPRRYCEAAAKRSGRGGNLARFIQEHIKKPLAEELLFGKLEKGGGVRVTIEDGKPAFDYPEPPEAPPPAKRRKSRSPAPVR